jgi:hypothetical protein
LGFSEAIMVERMEQVFERVAGAKRRDKGV